MWTIMKYVSHLRETPGASERMRVLPREEILLIETFKSIRNARARAFTNFAQAASSLHAKRRARRRVGD